MREMNILVTCDSGYAKQAALMLFSLLRCHPEHFLSIYAVGDLSKQDIALMGKGLDAQRCRITHVAFHGEMLKDAPTTDRYPVEMYYRIFAAQYLPEDMERVLYLDPDLTVIHPVTELYEMEMGDAFFAAASHVRENTPLEKLNQKRLDMDGIYINSGVMLLNLAALRKEQDTQEVLRYIAEHEKMLFLPDQDVISGLYHEKILPIESKIYNMTERMLMFHFLKGMDMEWVCRHTSIVHYCGRNKPWKPMYKGKLDVFYILNLLEWEKKVFG